MPADVPSGTLWMLGSTLAGASIGAQLGVPYAFAGHFAMAHARRTSRGIAAGAAYSLPLERR